MKIVPLSKEHIPFLVCAKNRDFLDGWGENALNSAFESQRFFGFVAVDGDDYCGFITCSFTSFDADIESVYVVKEKRRNGVARILINRITEAVKEKGLEGIFLEVRESNAPAIKLYEGAGFVKISVRKKYYSDGENAVIMKKEIKV